MKLFSSLRRAVRRFRDEERGAALVTFTVMIVVLLAFAAWVTDVGVAFWNQRQIQNGVDAGALGGAYYLAQGGSSTAVQTAVAAGSAMAENNGVSSSEISSVSNNPYVTTTYNLDDTLVVSAKRLDNYGLRYASGGSDVTIGTSASAIAVAMTPNGIWPLAVQVGSNCTAGCTIKEGAGGSYTGNFGFIQLGQSGGSQVQQNIINGYSGTIPAPTLSTGLPVWSWNVSTETGNVESATYNGFTQLDNWDAGKYCDGGVESCANLYVKDSSNQYNDQTSDGTACYSDTRCPRVGIIPVIAQQWAALTGNSTVTVIGFNCYYLQNFNSSGGKGKYTATFTYLGACYAGGSGGTPLYDVPLDSTGSVGIVLWR